MGLGFGLRWRIKRAILKRMVLKTPYVKIKVQGHDMLVKWQVNMIGLMYYQGIYEPETTAWLRKNLGFGDCVIDIGANIGYHTLIMADQVGDDGVVFSFEPSPELRAILKRNVTANKYNSRVMVSPKAVGSAEGKADFFVHRDHGQSSLIPRRMTTKVIEVETVSLDYAFSDFRNIDLVKIDVEGAEPQVLQGMQGLMREHPRMKIIFEFIPGHWEGEWDRVKELLSGYEMRALDHNMLCWRKTD